MMRYFIIRSARALVLFCKKYPRGIAHTDNYSWYTEVYNRPPVFEVKDGDVLSWCYRGYYKQKIGVKEVEFVTFSDYVELTKT